MFVSQYGFYSILLTTVCKLLDGPCRRIISTGVAVSFVAYVIACGSPSVMGLGTRVKVRTEDCAAARVATAPRRRAFMNISAARSIKVVNYSEWVSSVVRIEKEANVQADDARRETEGVVLERVWNAILRLDMNSTQGSSTARTAFGGIGLVSPRGDLPFGQLSSGWRSRHAQVTCMTGFCTTAHDSEVKICATHAHKAN